ncbi:phosphatidylserine decarboxylase [Thermosulfurimonas dismutans]|uniref:Phosphatidylserine decarboxylase proenzyme n=1 Tax=Thermosulfurimonas dismutans TaxID=999894 RepID=A0A179D435_9BACT|nr:phosphatidylserine decarboxylase [Thermosulfurimonas dismutans]OAQ20388.1 Phosphatidylserine decarboxylase [Thermosulfurimonas dismutans]
MKIAKEGLPFVTTFLGLSGISALIGRKKAALAGGFLAAATTYFFRDPSREPVWDKEALVSPADGVVAKVRYLPEFEGFPGPVYRIGVFMRLWDVHVNRAPVSGRIVKVAEFPGEKLPAQWEEAFHRNEKRFYWLERDDGLSILIIQVAGLLARRTVSYVRAGDEVLCGDRLGMIKFGSRVEVLFPAEGARILVREGHRVRAGETPLALLSWRGP